MDDIDRLKKYVPQKVTLYRAADNGMYDTKNKAAENSIVALIKNCMNVADLSSIHVNRIAHMIMDQRRMLAGVFSYLDRGDDEKLDGVGMTAETEEDFRNWFLENRQEPYNQKVSVHQSIRDAYFAGYVAAIP